MSLTHVEHSRLAFQDSILGEGIEFWDLNEFPEIVPQPNDQTHDVRSTDRIGLLADRYYRDPVLWWVIALANNMELLPNDLIAGTTIIIPAPSYILGPFFRNSLRNTIGARR